MFSMFCLSQFTVVSTEQIFLPFLRLTSIRYPVNPNVQSLSFMLTFFTSSTQTTARLVKAALLLSISYLRFR
jgi:hypothetical protein